MPTVKKGTRFYSAYADSNSLWEVKSVRGDICDCVIVNERWQHNGQWYDGDYAGVRKPFYKDQIEGILRMQATFDRLQQEHVDWFAQLKIGSIVHYHNAFGQYVRCEAVPFDPASHTQNSYSDKYAPGETVLLPLALVGTGWREHDLPRTILVDAADADRFSHRETTRVDADTIAVTLTDEYHVRSIVERQVFRPNASNMWEKSDDLQARHPGVPEMEPLSLAAADRIVDQRQVTA
jgi:hypothetical protein